MTKKSNGKSRRPVLEKGQLSQDTGLFSGKKNWRIQLDQSKVMGILFIYLLAANLTLIDQLDFLNQYDLGINLDYWEKNTVFFSSIVYWFNLFLYSCLVVWVAAKIIGDKITIYCTLSIPMYWLLLFIRNIEDANSEAEVFVPNLKFFLYGLLIVALLVMFIRILMIVESIRAKDKIEDIEQFKKEALNNLANINPYLNQQLVKEVVGKHGESFNLLLAANQENDERKKQLLTRLALIAMDHRSSDGITNLN